MSFDYASFRAAFVQARTAQRRKRLRQERAALRREATIRPTEFAAQVRAEASAHRLWLTVLERRVLHFDRRYLQSTPDARSDYVTAARAHYVGLRAGCRAQDVPRLLDAIEQVCLRAAVLGVTLQTELPRCVRRRSAESADDLKYRFRGSALK